MGLNSLASKNRRPTEMRISFDRAAWLPGHRIAQSLFTDGLSAATAIDMQLRGLINSVIARCPLTLERDADAESEKEGRIP